MKKTAMILAAFGLGLLCPSVAQSAEGHATGLISVAPPVLRPSPDLVIRLADGKQMSLSSLHGKVVMLMFIHTTCPICQQASETVSKLYGEYGTSGFLPVDVAFNSMADVYVPDFVTNFAIRYPVGSASLEEVAEYLNFPPSQRFTIPQIVWIDAQGDIRSQTPYREGGTMLTEGYWRNMIDTLLNESAGED